ncbi:hypothetical protein OUHCRE2_49650 [Enterobacter asburiae]
MYTTPWLTERHGYDPTYHTNHVTLAHTTRTIQANLSTKPIN